MDKQDPHAQPGPKLGAYRHVDNNGTARDATKEAEQALNGVNADLIEDLSGLDKSLQVGQLQASMAISAKRTADAMTVLAKIALAMLTPEGRDAVRQVETGAQKAERKSDEAVIDRRGSVSDEDMHRVLEGLFKIKGASVGAEVRNGHGDKRVVHIKTAEQFTRLMKALEDGSFDPADFHA